MHKRKTILAFIYLTIVLSISLCLFGISWGWLDDVYALKIISLPYLEELPADHFIFISIILKKLYHFAPSVYWFESFLLLIGLISVYYFLLEFFNEIGKFINTAFSVFITCAMFLIFFVEFLANLNFTRISLLATSVGLAGIIFNVIKKRPPVTYIIPFILWPLGVCIRPDVSFITTVLGAFVFILITLHRKMHLNKLILIFSLIMLFFASIYIYKQNSNLVRDPYHKERWHYIFHLLDASNYKKDVLNMVGEKEKVKFFALFSWYYYDSDIYDLKYLNGLKSNNFLKNYNKKFYTIKTRLQYEKLIKQKEFTTHSLNQFHKVLIIYLIILSLTMSIYYFEKKENKQVYSKFLCAFLFIYTFLFGCVTFFIKFEERVFTPTAVVYILILSVLFLKTNKRLGKIWVLPLILLLILRTYSFSVIAKDRKSESEKKNNFYIALNNNYHDHIIMTDVFSNTLFHHQPYKHNKTFDSLNVYQFGEHPFFQFPTYREKIRMEVCDYQSFPQFFECVQNRDDVVWVMPEFRIKILENYYSAIYNKEFKFEEVENQCGLENITFSFQDNQNFKLLRLKK